MKKLEKLLFDNAGKKIKKIALIFYIIEIIIGIIAGIIVAADTDGVGLLIIPATIIGAFLLNILIYGYGEIVDSCLVSHKNTSAAAGEFDSLPQL